MAGISSLNLFSSLLAFSVPFHIPSLGYHLSIENGFMHMEGTDHMTCGNNFHQTWLNLV